MDKKVAVVLPAAGSGERMKISEPKQFCEVQGKAVILHTLEAFCCISWVQNIIVVTSLDMQDHMINLCQNYSKVKVTLGGSSRHRSIYAGVKMVAQVQQDCEVVIIHDGVRPLIEADLLEDVVNAAYIHGAAGVVRPLTSTVVEVDSTGFLEKSLDRNQYRASEMPQAFRFGAILNAYQQCTDYDFDYGTECLHLAQKYAGSKVKLLDGPDYLWKITHKKDLYALSGILQDKLLGVEILTSDNTAGIANILVKSLSGSNLKVKTRKDYVTSCDWSCDGSCHKSCAVVLIENFKTVESLLSQWKCLHCQKYYDCVVSVIVAQEDCIALAFTNLGSLLRNTTDSPSFMYGIITQNACSEQLGRILLSLLKERNAAFNRQIIVIS